MKKRLTITALAVLCAACSYGEIKEQIVAVVNDDIITYSELEKILNPIFERYERIYSGAELFSMLQKARHDILEHLVQEKIILQEAKKQDVRAMMGDDFGQEVDRGITEARKKFGSEEDFIKELKREGMTFEQFKTEQEDRTLIRAMLIKEVSSKCSVSPLEVKDYYETHKGEFTEGEKVRASQIWIKNNPENAAESERLAKEILGRLNHGESFAALAKKYSQCPYASRGGDWGFIGKGHWNKELEDAVFSLQPGRHSGVIKTDLGWHLVMVQERKPATVKPLDEVYADIENRLFGNKVTAKRDEWIKRLKKKSYVSIVK